jgi:hypothetical protein
MGCRGFGPMGIWPVAVSREHQTDGAWLKSRYGGRVGHHAHCPIQGAPCTPAACRPKTTLTTAIPWPPASFMSVDCRLLPDVIRTTLNQSEIAVEGERIGVVKLFCLVHRTRWNGKTPLRLAQTQVVLH